MTASLRVLTMGTGSGLADDRVQDLDLYALPDTDLSAVRGLLVGVHTDQVFLARHRDRLTRFVESGGRVAVCGQVVRPYLAGLISFVPARYRGVADLTVHRLAEHPVWAGVDPGHLTFRRGVAGFYGRGHYPDLPADALVVHALGAAAAPLDAVYPLGEGQVLLHGGNDLWGYADDDTTAAWMTPQLLRWLQERP